MYFLSRIETVCLSYCLFIFTLFQTVQRHGVCIAAYGMQLVLYLSCYYYLVSICRKLTIIYRQLDNNHLIQLLWLFFIHLKLAIMSATLGSVADPEGGTAGAPPPRSGSQKQKKTYFNRNMV